MPVSYLPAWQRFLFSPKNSSSSFLKLFSAAVISESMQTSSLFLIFNFYFSTTAYVVTWWTRPGNWSVCKIYFGINNERGYFSNSLVPQCQTSSTVQTTKGTVQQVRVGVRETGGKTNAVFLSWPYSVERGHFLLLSCMRSFTWHFYYILFNYCIPVFRLFSPAATLKYNNVILRTCDLHTA